MAEIILEPTALSKVIPLKFKINDVDVPKTTQLSTNKQFNTTDTDAWFTFELDGLASTNGTYDLTLINLDDKSIFHHADVLFSALPFHYKLNSSEDVTLNEIRHAGRWLGQLVVTMSNGDTTARQFGFNISGHILDGQDAQVILLSDYQALINTINLAKDDLTQYNVDYAALIADVDAAEAIRAQAEIDRAETFNALVESEMVAQNVEIKLTEKEATFAPRMLSLEEQLAQSLAMQTGLLAFKGSDTTANINAKAGMVTGDYWWSTDGLTYYAYNGASWSNVGSSLTELSDIRLGVDAVTYPTAGDAIRCQITDTIGKIDNQDYKISFDEKENILEGVTFTNGFYSSGVLSYPSGYMVSEPVVVNLYAEKYYKVHKVVPIIAGVPIVTFFDVNETYVAQVTVDQIVDTDLIPIPQNAAINYAVFNLLDENMSIKSVVRYDKNKVALSLVGRENKINTNKLMYGNIDLLSDAVWNYGYYRPYHSAVISAYGYKCHEPVSVEGGAYYKFSDRPFGDHSVVFLNDDNEDVWVYTSTDITSNIILIPVNATKLIGNFHCDVATMTNDKITLKKCDVNGVLILDDYQAVYHDKKTKHNRLYNKKGAIIGDSIAWGQGATNNWSDRYSKAIADYFEMDSMTNYAYPGASVSSIANASYNLIGMIDAVPSDIETFFLNCGVNDFGNSVPLGVFTDNTDVSFFGALHVLCNKIITKLPNAEIVYITPFHTQNDDGLESYRNAIDIVCKYYGFKVINGFECGLTTRNATALSTLYSGDGLHPSTNGYRKIATSLICEVG